MTYPWDVIPYTKCEYERTWETICDNKRYRTTSCTRHRCDHPEKRCDVKRFQNELNENWLGGKSAGADK